MYIIAFKSFMKPSTIKIMKFRHEIIHSMKGSFPKLKSLTREEEKEIERENFFWKRLSQESMKRAWTEEDDIWEDVARNHY